MQNSKALMQRAEIYPRIKLGTKQPKGGVVSTGKHIVRMIKDKITMGRDRESGKIIEVMKYILEEDGVKKEYRCPLKNKETNELHYLVQILSKVPENGEVSLEMKKAGPRNYVEVLNLDGSRIDAGEDDANEIVDEPTDEEVDAALGEMPEKP